MNYSVLGLDIGVAGLIPVVPLFVARLKPYLLLPLATEKIKFEFSSLLRCFAIYFNPG